MSSLSAVYRPGPPTRRGRAPPALPGCRRGRGRYRLSFFPAFRFPESKCLGFISNTCRSASPFFPRRFIFFCALFIIVLAFFTICRAQEHTTHVHSQVSTRLSRPASRLSPRPTSPPRGEALTSRCTLPWDPGAAELDPVPARTGTTFCLAKSCAQQEPEDWAHQLWLPLTPTRKQSQPMKPTAPI